ncbi:hypothetical protein Peur_055948 [Populus x canadensis]
MCMRSYLLISSFETNFSQCLANHTRNPSLSLSRSPRVSFSQKNPSLSFDSRGSALSMSRHERA